METKGVTCKIPLDLHNRITEEIRQNDSTMSKFIEQIILEHYTKGATTMGKTRTLAFQVSEELFQQIKDYLARYEQAYHRKLSQKESSITCAFLLASGAPWPPCRAPELCGAALKATSAVTTAAATPAERGGFT